MSSGANGNTTNTISFDLEHWHSATLVAPEVDDPVDHIEQSVDIVLDLLSRRGVTATFFVVGELADAYPALVRRIADGGHEIASHGHTHTPLFDLTPETFERELSRSAAAIRRAVGRDPIGFRAPNFSVSRETEWAFPILESSDYAYDSSVFPRETPMYGVSGAPLRPYRVAVDFPFESVSEGRADDGLVEFPLAVTDTPIRIPIAGGFYARMLPPGVLERGIRRLNRHGVPATLYFHPWEFNPEISYRGISPHRRFVSSFGTDRLEAKIDRLLWRFDFAAMEERLPETTRRGVRNGIQN